MLLTAKTFPITTVSTVSGLTLPDVSAAFAAISCSCKTLVFTNFPPYDPNGVRLAATMNIPVQKWKI